MGSRPVWRVRERASFDAVRRGGLRVRRGPVSLVFVPAAAGAAAGVARPRAAFAIGRDVGGAVVRNRARRRLRSVLDEVASDGGLAPGTWLVSTRSDLADVTPAELRSLVVDAAAAAAGRVTA